MQTHESKTSRAEDVVKHFFNSGNCGDFRPTASISGICGSKSDLSFQIALLEWPHTASPDRKDRHAQVLDDASAVG